MGIRHRIKRTAKNEAHPTEVVILGGKETIRYELEDDDAELDFVRGQFPTSHRKVTAADDTRTLPERHLKMRKMKPEEAASIPEEHRRQIGKDVFAVTQIPATYDGLAAGDTIGMTLGGSGDRLAFALSRKGEDLTPAPRMMRIPPSVMEKLREGRDKAEDAAKLAELVRDQPNLFTLLARRERDLIRVVEAYRARTEAMEKRIECEQRLHQHMIGLVFCTEEGGYPEGSIEQEYDLRKASDVILRGLVAEEAKRLRELTRVLEELGAYAKLFKQIEGVGPGIAAHVVVAVGDIRRFATLPRFRAFMGVHVLRGGVHGETPTERQFPRQRAGAVANWHPNGRQAMYLLADQFNRRPDSEWGKKLLEYKIKFRATHPDVLCSKCGCRWEDCAEQKEKSHTRRYTNGHIHKMALWRTVTKFVEWLYRAWWKLEKERLKAETEVASAAA